VTDERNRNGNVAILIFTEIIKIAFVSSLRILPYITTNVIQDVNDLNIIKQLCWEQNQCKLFGRVLQVIVITQVTSSKCASLRLQI
jgi:hypothetical protein